MKTNLTLLGSVVLLTSVGLTACDSATATNDKAAVEVKKAVVEEVQKVADKAPVAVKESVEKMVEAAPVAKEAAVKVVEKTKQVVSEVKTAKVEEVKEVVAEVKAAVNTPEATAAKSVTAAPAIAQSISEKKSEFKEGTHYFEIFPTMQTDAAGGKIEVVELFWLGCPHCFTLEPTIKEYKKNLPSYVDFKQVPAMLNASWARDAKVFYIAELLDPKGKLKLVDKLFNAIHVQKRKSMNNPKVAKEFILQQGISEADYDNAANSMVITAKLNRARQVSADSQANSVPSIIINGKYRTSPYAAGNEKKLMQVVDMLTKRELEKK